MSTASFLNTPSGLTLDELKQALFQNASYRLGQGIIDIVKEQKTLQQNPTHYSP